jgi:hypothetical protein
MDGELYVAYLNIQVICKRVLELIDWIGRRKDGCLMLKGAVQVGWAVQLGVSTECRNRTHLLCEYFLLLTTRLEGLSC